MKKKKSILFVQPDYHCSFFYRDELRKKGWKVDIYVPWGYPEELLYSAKEILRPPRTNGSRTFVTKYIDHLLLVLWWFLHFWRYEYHVYYGRPPVIRLFEKELGLTKIFGKDFLIELWVSKALGIKLIFLPSGCHDDEIKAEITKLDNGNVCGNCGAWDKCFDEKNVLNFDRIRRFFDMQIGVGAIDSTQFEMSHIKYKSIDLSLWNPSLKVPEQHRLPETKNVRVLHSAYLEKSGRSWQGRNIKGSAFVISAIERLKKEGYPVEYYFIKDKPSNQMRFYQLQADIAVEQLIYGWWGSTFVETSALGKPVVCYLRPSWKKFFLKKFPEYNELPIVEANIENIYEVLKRLVTDDAYRLQKGKDSRRFAELHFDPVKNTQNLVSLFEAL